jgi:hypothetical protein
MRAAVILALLVGCQVAQPVNSPAPVRNVDAMIGRTVLLDSPGCTGIRVGGGHIVTAQHCVEGNYLVGELYTGYTVEYISPDYDFAVLAGDEPYMPATLTSAVIGEHVYVVGYPVSIDDNEQQLTVTDGVFTGATDGYLERVTAYGYYGNSGGGVWNDAAELVGVLVEIRPALDGWYGTAPMPAHSYMVPVDLVARFL